MAMQCYKRTGSLFDTEMGTGRDFRDATQPVTLLINRPVNRRKFSALDRPIDRQNYNI